MSQCVGSLCQKQSDESFLGTDISPLPTYLCPPKLSLNLASYFVLLQNIQIPVQRTLNPLALTALRPRHTSYKPRGSVAIRQK